MTRFIAIDGEVREVTAKPLEDGRLSVKLTPGRGRPQIFDAADLHETREAAEAALAAGDGFDTVAKEGGGGRNSPPVATAAPAPDDEPEPSFDWAAYARDLEVEIRETEKTSK